MARSGPVRFVGRSLYCADASGIQRIATIAAKIQNRLFMCAPFAELETSPRDERARLRSPIRGPLANIPRLSLYPTEKVPSR